MRIVVECFLKKINVFTSISASVTNIRARINMVLTLQSSKLQLHLSRITYTIYFISCHDFI